MGPRSINDENRRRPIYAKEERSRQRKVIRTSVGDQNRKNCKVARSYIRGQTFAFGAHRLRRQSTQDETKYEYRMERIKSDESDLRRRMGCMK